MKKFTFMVALIGLFMITSVMSFARESGGMKGSMMAECHMHCSMMGMCPIHGCMMKMIMGKTIVATEDGGVVAMIGNKLMKYDKYLSFQKEVEMEIDMEGIEKMMMEIKEKCPMCKKMMQEGSRMDEGSAMKK